MDASEIKWIEKAKKQLLGRKIVDIRWMSKDEAADMDWYSRPIVLVLDDGNILYPSQDDEGNDGGALFTNHDTDGVMPVFRN